MPISVDPPEPSRALRERLGLSFGLYSDRDGEASTAFGVFDSDTHISLAATFVVARGGQIVFRFIGQDKRDRPSVNQLIDSLHTSS